MRLFKGTSVSPDRHAGPEYRRPFGSGLDRGRHGRHERHQLLDAPGGQHRRRDDRDGAQRDQRAGAGHAAGAHGWTRTSRSATCPAARRRRRSPERPPPNSEESIRAHRRDQRTVARLRGDRGLGPALGDHSRWPLHQGVAGRAPAGEALAEHGQQGADLGPSQLRRVRRVLRGLVGVRHAGRRAGRVCSCTST